MLNYIALAPGEPPKNLNHQKLSQSCSSRLAGVHSRQAVHVETHKLDYTLNSPRTMRCSRATERNPLSDFLARDTYRQAPSAQKPTELAVIAWQNLPHYQTPLATGPHWFVAIAWRSNPYRQVLHQYLCFTDLYAHRGDYNSNYAPSLTIEFPVNYINSQARDTRLSEVARPGEGYWNSRPSGSPSPKRELQGFITGLGFEHLAQATILVLERLGLSLRRETLA
ncbi:hypothetical protein DEO72_LG4g429 [Vigna unguiculata]|uniref:Uncharacterized protein n=1 Tax=Vigna unguiculata TaxID=3917 RepID=A0A4D6LN81_VIGUN|nr:hypothetical protein DEO72_LG4g429 [Vigna unguiculata]